MRASAVGVAALGAEAEDRKESIPRRPPSGNFDMLPLRCADGKEEGLSYGMRAAYHRRSHALRLAGIFGRQRLQPAQCRPGLARARVAVQRLAPMVQLLVGGGRARLAARHIRASGSLSGAARNSLSGGFGRLPVLS